MTEITMYDYILEEKDGDYKIVAVETILSGNSAPDSDPSES